MISGKVTTKKQLNAIISDASELDGVVSIGGTVVGASLSQRGVAGAKGDTGATGQDGHSPIVTASKAGKVTTVYVDGSSVATINDGNDGQDGQDGTDGQDGHSPVVTASKVGKVTTVSVDGSAIATINDGNDGQTGSDGQDGADGYSPSASVSKSGSIATITITDKNGTTTASVSDGSGVPTGGTSGQVLTKHSATDYDVSWEDPSGGTVTDVEVNGVSVVEDGVAEVTVPTKVSDLTNDSGFITGMTILSYGSSTWQNFIDAYNAKKVVYCRASSNSNPGSGSQTRLAFMAYVNNATTPTEVEFQYYRSVSSHSASQQGDQVFVYKLNSAGTWSVTTREASSKIVAGTNMSSSYSSGVLTLTSSGEANVQSDWNEADNTKDDYIKNKPTIPTKVSELNNDSGFITTETDPVFTASDAYGIDSTDITNWDNSYNGKVSLDTSAQSGTTDGDLYAAIVALGWESDVIE